MRKHFLFALLAVLFTVLPARVKHNLVAADAVWHPMDGVLNVHP